MPIEETLARIEGEIAAGDLGKARDRLHGLLSTYPADLMLRRKLGDVYWRLQYPEMAGRYWYLVEEKSPQMLEACDWSAVKGFFEDEVRRLMRTL